MTQIIIGTLLLPLIIYAPGWALTRVIPELETNDGLERHFERCLIGALWSGWLALVLASFGIFSIWLHLGITLAVSAGLIWLGQRHSPPRTAVPRTAVRGYAVTLLVLALLVARPFEVILGVRDAGVYAVTGFAIARTGSIVQTDAVVAELGQAAQSSDPAVREPAEQAISNLMIGQARDRYIATRLRAAGFLINEGELAQGRIVPQGFHLFPAWIGLLTAAGGPLFGLFATGLLGLLGVWSVGMIGRRLAGPWVGWLGMVLLGLNAVQVWFSRYSTAETTAQFLTWGGLYLFAKFNDHGLPARARIAYAALAGIAFGQVALARIDFFLLAPAILYLGYCWLTRRWQHVQTALALGMLVMLVHAALHIIFIARAYFFDTGFARFQDFALTSLIALPFLTPAVRESYFTSKFSSLGDPGRIWIELALIGLIIVALIMIRRSGRLLHIERQMVSRRQSWQNAIALGLVLLAGWAYFVRPQIIDADLLFNTRGGWNDPLTRDPNLVAGDVRSGVMTPTEARLQAGVVLTGRPWEAEPDLAATEALRTELAATRGPWQGPFSNQTLNWLRIQGYVGAPIRLPLVLYYQEYNGMSWWQRMLADPSTFTSEPAPVQPKELIPLAGLVRVGWYLSPLGVVLAVIGFALWWRRGLSAASWLMLTVGFLGSFFYLRQTYGTSEQTYIYILRRFVPIAYPIFALSAAYALAALAGAWQFRPHAARWRQGLAAALAGLLILFLGWTGRYYFVHTEYAGALAQVEAIAKHFTPDRDIVLLRGGAPIYSDARDIPDLLATPLRFAYDINAFTVKSVSTAPYATLLAEQVKRWQAAGRTVYLMLSASGGNLALPGFHLTFITEVALDLAEFEQLTDQKPQNVSRLTLPFAIYRLDPVESPVVDTAPPPLTPTSFAAQVSGFYRPEQSKDGWQYSWSNGEAVLRLPWPADAVQQTVAIEVAGGLRPDHLGPATLCIAAQREDTLWPTTSSPLVELGCHQIGQEPTLVRVTLDPTQLPPTTSGALLLHLSGPAWIPANEDPRLTDRRVLHVQIGHIWIHHPSAHGTPSPTL
ncbi:ArnT family glycosyltransferase [Chloroflexus aggregans]|uniref:Glycosyltransferase RgtA/B/C/D-like domain-containing protein n=1 Tax=Chloroflexus aggregans (strain MD-66 / DSM 9485) TaxID=326427 RepID=B8G5U3_CHLAD|nr:hypothetical protein [Chloroflexus aggregans]ACL23804.1 conserved hypothetical protein [Chloroflexus aggregans DSM 9485]